MQQHLSKTHLIANRLKEVLLNGKWIANTNFKEQLINSNWQKATNKIDNLNTIALLTFHINYYLKGIMQVFDGGDLEIKDKYSFDLPEITTEKDWDLLVTDFLNNATNFANKVEQLPDDILDKTFVEEKYGTYQRNLEAVIEHSYYHLGQVVLLSKLIDN
jgi:uncharacterized damage-inducible protein DinB